MTYGDANTEPGRAPNGINSEGLQSFSNRSPPDQCQIEPFTIHLATQRVMAQRTRSNDATEMLIISVYGRVSGHRIGGVLHHFFLFLVFFGRKFPICFL